MPKYLIYIVIFVAFGVVGIVLFVVTGKLPINSGNSSDLVYQTSEEPGSPEKEKTFFRIMVLDPSTSDPIKQAGID